MVNSLELAQTALALDLASWPSVQYKARIQVLPRTAGFYCVWSDSKPLYIGESRSIYDRWYGGHKHRAVARTAEIRYFTFESERLDRQFIEWMLIIIHQPPLNSFKNIRQLWYDTLTEAGWQPVVACSRSSILKLRSDANYAKNNQSCLPPASY